MPLPSCPPAVPPPPPRPRRKAELETRLQLGETAEQRRLRERNRVEEADNDLTEDLFGGGGAEGRGGAGGLSSLALKNMQVRGVPQNVLFVGFGRGEAGMGGYLRCLLFYGQACSISTNVIFAQSIGLHWEPILGLMVRAPWRSVGTGTCMTLFGWRERQQSTSLWAWTSQGRFTKADLRLCGRSQRVRGGPCANLLPCRCCGYVDF